MAKRIGILCSGGDCAGLNATIRAVVLAGAREGWEIVGIRNGTAGLMNDPPLAETMAPERMDSVLLRLGGTVLGTTNRGDPFAFPMADGATRDRSGEVIAGWRRLGCEALIGIGGDGSMAILRKLAQQGGIGLVGIPKTIDNDVTRTERALGFSTAVVTATEALDRLQPTAASHSRIMVLEVMGRDAGHIAIAAGIAGGADVVLIPEIRWRLEPVVRKIDALKAAGRNFALVMVAEAVRDEHDQPIKHVHADGEARYGGIGEYVSARLAAATGAETRVTVLGHVQRGAPPVPEDRLLAAAFGVHAVELVKTSRFDRMVAWWNRRVIDVPLAEIVDRARTVDPDGALVLTARGLGICLGDA
jgi:6-phosphofructokinase 1